MTSYALVIRSYTQEGSALQTALLMLCSYAPYVTFSIFAIPAILHLYDIIVGFDLGIEKSYVPVVVFTAIHMVYRGVIYVKSKKASPSAAK